MLFNHFLTGMILQVSTTQLLVATFPEHFLPPEPVHVIFLLQK